MTKDCSHPSKNDVQELMTDFLCTRVCAPIVYFARSPFLRMRDLQRVAWQRMAARRFRVIFVVRWRPPRGPHHHNICAHTRVSSVCIIYVRVHVASLDRAGTRAQPER